MVSPEAAGPSGASGIADDAPRPKRPKPMASAEAANIFFMTVPFLSMSRDARRLALPKRAVETNATTSDANGGGASDGASPNGGDASPSDGDASGHRASGPLPVSA